MSFVRSTVLRNTHISAAMTKLWLSFYSCQVDETPEDERVSISSEKRVCVCVCVCVCVVFSANMIGTRSCVCVVFLQIWVCPKSLCPGLRGL